MHSKETSKEPKRSLKSLSEHKSSKARFKDARLVKQALAECLINNDLPAFRDVLIAYFKAKSKTRLVAQTGIGRQTIYDLMTKKDFNPKIKTIGLLIEAIA